MASALIVEVPEAEPAVARHRAWLDASAPFGVPAHVTVLYPFTPPETIDTPVLARLERLFGQFRRFRYQLDRTSWFGQDVLWLSPSPPGPFRALTEHVCQVFPAFAPYQGQFADVIPHLTIGHDHSLDDLRAAEESVQAHLPIDSDATAVTLITQQSPGTPWAKAATFALA